MKLNIPNIIPIILRHYPEAQAVYLFGSHTAGDTRPDSDIDIALLLPAQQARQRKNLALSDCRLALEKELHRPVDLVNARLASTVLQKEIIFGDRIFCSDPYATDEFEMLTLSYYQKLNEERSQIIEEFQKTGRAYAV